MKKVSEKRFAAYKKAYSYFKREGRQALFLGKKFKELNLNDLLGSRHFTMSKLSSITINLDERFFNIQQGSHFDLFVRLTLPEFNDKGTRALTINVPLRHHKHSNSFAASGFNLRKCIQLKKVGEKIYFGLVWEKDEVEKEVVGDKKVVGVDVGYKKLIATSDGKIIGSDMLGIYEQIVRKKKNSMAQRKVIASRDEALNSYVKELFLGDFDELVVEDLKDVKKGKKYWNSAKSQMPHWVYAKLIKRIEMTCEVKGISLVKVSPAYTSQTCSECGSVNEKSRKGEDFKCIDCGMEMDADLNAAINIRNRGVMVPLSKKD
jgi:IS605 OrfB family transposase